MKVEDSFITSLEEWYSEYQKKNYFDGFYHHMVKYIENNLADYIIEKRNFSDGSILSISPVDIKSEGKYLCITVNCRCYEPLTSKRDSFDNNYAEKLSRFDIVFNKESKRVTIKDD